MTAQINSFLLETSNELKSRLCPFTGNIIYHSTLEMKVDFYREENVYSEYSNEHIEPDSIIPLNKYSCGFSITGPGDSSIIEIDKVKCDHTVDLGYILRSKNNMTYHEFEEKNWVREPVNNIDIFSSSNRLLMMSLPEIFDNISKEILSYIKELSSIKISHEYTERFVTASFEYNVVFAQDRKLTISLLNSGIEIMIVYKNKSYPIQPECLISTLTAMSNGTFSENTFSISDIKPNLEKIAAYRAECVLRDATLLQQRKIDEARWAIGREERRVAKEAEQNARRLSPRENPIHILEKNLERVNWSTLARKENTVLIISPVGFTFSAIWSNLRYFFRF